MPPIVHDVLRSSGQPLNPATRAFMEPWFGHDFGRVRVHVDGQAAESAQAVNALAYTMGNDVVLGAGKYDPQSEHGDRLGRRRAGTCGAAEWPDVGYPAVWDRTR